MKKNERSEVYEISSQRLLELEKKIADAREKLSMARLNGDRKENADQAILEVELENLRIQYLFLKNKLILAKNKAEARVMITYRLLANNEKKKVELTEEWAADPDQGRISITSPLGLALMNKKVGEVSEVHAKEGSYKIQIISIN